MCLVEPKETRQVWKLLVSNTEASSGTGLDLVDDVMADTIFLSEKNSYHAIKTTLSLSSKTSVSGPRTSRREVVHLS